MNQVITVPHLHSPTRLDKFLSQELAGFSRNSIQQAIKKGDIKVNGKKVPPHHFLKTDEKIEINLSAPHQPKIIPNKNIYFDVIAETPDYLIINKPAGLVVHPAQGLYEPTLVDGLIAQYPEIKNVGEDKLRPGIVHRLDREASGLLLVARSQEMFEYIKKEFQERRVHKEYTALVIGKMTKQIGDINFPLARSKSKHGKAAARPEQGADTRDAITHFEVIKEFQQVTLLKVIIETGRTHQIRAHLAALRYPIVGDDLYRPAKLAFKTTPGRLFLHSTKLSFIDLASYTKTFSCELPAELKEFLNKLT